MKKIGGKRIAIAALVLCFLCVLAGCKKGTVTDAQTTQSTADNEKVPSLPGELSKEKEIEILRAYYKENTDDLSGDGALEFSVRFLGEYSGAYAVFIDGFNYSDVPTDETVNGIVFSYPSSQRIELYYGGSFYSLNAAFSNGILSGKDVSALYAVYTKTDAADPEKGSEKYPETMFFESVAPISYEKALEIRKAYYNANILSGTLSSVSDISLRGLGEYGGAYALLIDGPAYSDEPTEENVDGIIFKYPTSQTVSVYSDWCFYSLSDALSNGIVSKRDVYNIYNIYMKSDIPYAETKPYAPAALSDEKIVEIDGAWQRKNGYSLNWVSATPEEYCGGIRYYGTFGDAVVFFFPKDGEISKTTLGVSYVSFKYATDFCIYVYQNDHFFLLESAYMAGMLTDDQIILTEQYHNEFENEEPYIKSYSDAEIIIPEPVTEELREEVAYRIRMTYGYSYSAGVNMKYYGKYNGNHIFFNHRRNHSDTKKIFGGYVFEYTKDFNIFVYTEQRHVFFLEDAYSLGLLRESDIACLAKYHYYYDALEEISETLGELDPKIGIEIITAYRDINKVSELFVLSMHYFGEYGGAYAVTVWEGTSYSDIITQNVCGLTFIYPNAWTLKIYRDGAFYELEAAYEKGIISKEDVETLYGIYNEKCGYDFDSDVFLPVSNYIKASLLYLLDETWIDNSPEENLAGMRYYGTYNGYVVLFDNDARFSSKMNVGGIEFNYYKTFNIWVYDGKDMLCDLVEAFEKKMLDAVDVLRIFEYHNKFDNINAPVA